MIVIKSVVQVVTETTEGGLELEGVIEIRVTEGASPPSVRQVVK